MPDLSSTDWLLLVLAAGLVGFAKTAIGAVATISVAIFATVLPARESTGTLLPLLLCGDLMAVLVYRRHADWALLLRLFPWVALGTGIGVLFIARVDDTAMRRTIGLVLLALSVLQLVSRGGRLQEPVGSPESDRPRTNHRVSAAAVGIAAGFATMVANAGGAVMTLYLLLSGLTMLEFLGTGAWFFLIVNAFKLPFSAALGLLTPSSLVLDLKLAPAVFVGGAVGILVIRRINQKQFERAALLLTAASALPLVL